MGHEDSKDIIERLKLFDSCELGHVVSELEYELFSRGMKLFWSRDIASIAKVESITAQEMMVSGYQAEEASCTNIWDSKDFDWIEEYEEQAGYGPQFGCIYLVRADLCPHVKIGRAQSLKRLVSFGVIPPFDFYLEHAFLADNYVRAEQALHERYGAWRRNGEWFELDHRQIVDFNRIRCFRFGRFYCTRSASKPKERVYVRDLK